MDHLNNIQIAIGSKSSGEAYCINLATLPNLFVSYSHDNQLPATFASFIQQLLKGNAGCRYCLSVGSKNAARFLNTIPADQLFMAFTHAENEDGKIHSIDEFVKALVAEAGRRKVANKKNGVAISAAPLIVFIDDIFEVIMSSHKKTVLSFISLLISAAAVNMFFIIGSCGIYRSLLEQVINVTPSLRLRLQKSAAIQNLSQPLGAELVINPDDLLFFRERNQREYKRLYGVTGLIL